MKLAVLGESTADETFIRIIAAAILGADTQNHEGPQPRSRGWPSVQQILRSVIFGNREFGSRSGGPTTGC